MFRMRRRSGFTLIELLVVIAILAVLMGLLLPAVQKVRAASIRTYCANNLHNLGAAMTKYEWDTGSYPPGLLDAAGKWQYISWLARILSNVEQDNTFKEIQKSEDAGNTYPWNNTTFPSLGRAEAIYTCPADPRGPQAKTIGDPLVGQLTLGFTWYLANSGTNSRAFDGVIYLNSKVKKTEVTDGLSNTFFIGERPPSVDLEFGWWMAGWGQTGDGSEDVVLGALEKYQAGGWSVPIDGNLHGYPPCVVGKIYPFGPGNIDNPCDQFHYWSLHPGGGANFLMGDGSVRFITYAAGATVLPKLATRAGGEIIDNNY